MISVYQHTSANTILLHVSLRTTIAFLHVLFEIPVEKKQHQNPRCYSLGVFFWVEEIWDSYGADVHADYEYLRSCSLGQPVKFRIRLDGCWDGGMESEGPGYLSIPDGPPKIQQ